MSDQANAPQDHEEHVVLGMAAAVGAFFMFTVMNMFAKLLSANHSVIEIAFYRNLIASVPFLLAAFAFGRRDILVVRSKPILVGARAALGALSLIATFAAFEAGEASLTDVLDALRASVDVQLARLESLDQALAAERELEAAIGRPILPGGSS